MASVSFTEEIVLFLRLLDSFPGPSGSSWSWTRRRSWPHEHVVEDVSIEAGFRIFSV